MKTKSPIGKLILSALIWAAAVPAEAASFKEAEFTRVINDVRVLPIQQAPQPAQVGTKITGQSSVSTGVESRAELRFPDKTITRIGSNSVFRLDRGDRTVNLEKGVILLQVPKQLGGAKVRTAAVTAAVTGTSVLFEYTPDGYIKIIVLEGEVDVFFNDRPGVMTTLHPGDLLIMKPDATVFPMPVQVDLEKLKATCKLLDPNEFGPPINVANLNDAQAEQDKLKKDGELLKTAFQIPGRGTVVTLTNEARQEIFKNIVLQARPTPTGQPPAPPETNNRNPEGGNEEPPADPTVPNTASPPGTPIRNPGTVVFTDGSSIVTNPHATAYSDLANAIITMQGTIYRPNLDGNFRTYLYGQSGGPTPVDAFLASHGNWFAFLADEIYIAGDIGVNSSVGPRNIALAAQGNVTFADVSERFPMAGGGNNWTLPPSVDALVISTGSGSITVDSSFSLNGTLGQPQHVFFDASGPTSDVTINGGGFYPPTAEGSEVFEGSGGLPPISFPDGSFHAVAGRDISVLSSGSYAPTIEAAEVKMDAGRDINVEGSQIRARALIQMKALANLTISNSSQLVALSEGDQLSVFLAAVDGNASLLQAYVDAFSLEVSSDHGNVSITNSQVYADVVKARVLSTGGELLIADSTIGKSGSQLTRLYGEGASGVRFSGTNYLNSNIVNIAGKSVTIDSGGTVRLLNPGGTSVFTDMANFNHSSFGNFTDGEGTTLPSVTTQPFGNRPAY
jgi:hypothetical protein